MGHDLRCVEVSNRSPCMIYDALDVREPPPGAFRVGRPRPTALRSGAIGDKLVSVSPAWLVPRGRSTFSHSSMSIWPTVGSISVPSRETLTSRWKQVSKEAGGHLKTHIIIPRIFNVLCTMERQRVSPDPLNFERGAPSYCSATSCGG